MSKIKSGWTGYVESVKSFVWIRKNKKNTKNYILIGSHVLDGGGAPIVLWESIQIIKEMGYQVVVVSPSCGKLAEEIREKSIAVLCCKRWKNFLRRTILKQDWKAIIMNTTEMYQWVEEASSDVPILWWFHEGATYAASFQGEASVFRKNKLLIACVSEWSRKCLQPIGVSSDTRILYYGLPDVCPKDFPPIREDNGKIHFVLIGSICERKCIMDYLIAIQSLQEDTKRQTHFTLIGQPIPTELNYAKEVEQQVKRMGETVTYIASVPRSRMINVYKDADVLVCTSKDDPLPVVVTDAFMYRRCVLVSDGIGQYPLIEDGVNGFGYHAGDINALISKIEDIVEKKAELANIAQKGRLLYEQKFTIESHRNELKDVLKNMGI